MELININQAGKSRLQKIPFHLFKRYDDSHYSDIEYKIKDEDEKKEEKRYFLCKLCRNTITSYETKINVNGHHSHSFINPAGIEYNIGCFSSASGCNAMGQPTSEFTWFPGFSWSYAICTKCMIHMGWSYQSSGSVFYGLILDNLIVS